MAQGPLNGVRIVEFAGIGPGPFCGMLLSDLGADVIRIDRKGDGRPGRAADVMSRGRRSIGLNLKDTADVETALKLIEKADGLIEGFRPGVNVKHGGEGQVIDVAMSDGAASLATMFYGMKAMGLWTDDREANLLDGGAHFYDTYECSDGKWVSIGSIEPQFYALLLEKAGLTDPGFQAQMDRSKWPDLKQKIMAVFKTKTRDEWCEIMEGTDICFAPVLSMSEAPSHKHNVDRQTFVEIEGVVQPAPAPRFSATPGAIQGRPAGLGEHSGEILKDWGIQ